MIRSHIDPRINVATVKRPGDRFHPGKLAEREDEIAPEEDEIGRQRARVVEERGTERNHVCIL